jgi:hypothetical protein
MNAKGSTSKTKSITSAAVIKADSVKAQEILWKLLDGRGSQLIALENRLIVLRELFTARSNSGDEADLALLTHVEDCWEALEHSRTQIQTAYRCLTGERQAPIEGGAR